MKEIPLTQGKVALVDDEDYERLSKNSYIYMKEDNRAFCGRTPMSHIILQVNGIIDHKDGNGLNNQKSNLRVCTSAQNQYNAKKRKGKTSSQYKGVSFDNYMSKWRVRIGFINIFGQNIREHIGNFLVEEDAARAYDEAARKYHGEFAALNFPKEEERSCL